MKVTALDNHLRRTRALASFGYALSLLLGVAAAHAQGEICDPSLPSPKDDPQGYRLREDRCEGRYVKEVGGTTLVVGSLVETFESLDRSSTRPLRILWPVPPAAEEVHLRAQGVKRRLYYRMDTRRPAAAGSYLWPSSPLLSVIERREDIGVLAMTRLTIGRLERDVYLPVRVGYTELPSRGERYELIVIPGMQLTEVFVTLSQAGADGGERRVLRKNEPLQYGYYPADRAIPIGISGLGPAGFYRIELAARLESGGAATRELWFYHPGKP
jgi:hypothetical protein